MLRDGRFAEALHTLDEALSLGADPYACYLTQSRAYHSLGRVTEAIDAAEKAVAARPKELGARELVLVLTLEARDFTRTLRVSREMIRLWPSHVQARQAMGEAYMNLGDYRGALRVLNELVRLEPRHPLHRVRRAALFEHMGETRRALEDLETALDMTNDTELMEVIRSQIETLDLVELQHILMLAEDDVVFRLNLLRDHERAVFEKGFALSEWGLNRLEEMLEKLATEAGLETRPQQYH